MDRIYLVTHSKGTTILPLADGLDQTVPKIPVVRDKSHEAYVTELRSGDTIYVEGQSVATSIDEVKGILKRTRKSYAQDRAYSFIELSDGKSAHETTRLRYDLFKSAARDCPELFTRDELDNLDNCIFKRVKPGVLAGLDERGIEAWKYDFSKQTLSRVVDYVKETAERGLRDAGLGRAYDRSSIRSWLHGDVIHPTGGASRACDLERAYWIADALGAKDFAARASEIELAARQAAKNPAAKDDSPYFRLVDAHRSVMSALEGFNPKRDGDARRTSATPEKNNVRVHQKTADWLAALVEELGPRIEGQIVEATVHSVEMKERAHEAPSTQARTGVRGLHRNVVLVGSEEVGRDVAYAKIGIEKPVRRVDTLKNDVKESVQAFGEICKVAVPHYMAVMNKGYHAGTKIFTERGEDHLIIDIHDLRFLSPVLGYNHERLFGEWEWFDNKTAELLKNRELRREYVRSMRKAPPNDWPELGDIKRLYESSVMLQSTFDENSFIRRFTSAMRHVDANTIDRIASQLANVEVNRRGRMLIDNKSVEAKDAIRALAADAKYVERKSQLMQIDGRIPSDITMFRNRPMVASALDKFNEHETERKLFYEVLHRYGLDPDEIMNVMNSSFSEASALTEQGLSERNEKITFAGPGGYLREFEFLKSIKIPGYTVRVHQLG